MNTKLDRGSPSKFIQDHPKPSEVILNLLRLLTWSCDDTDNALGCDVTGVSEGCNTSGDGVTGGSDVTLLLSNTNVAASNNEPRVCKQ